MLPRLPEGSRPSFYSSRSALRRAPMPKRKCSLFDYASARPSRQQFFVGAALSHPLPQSCCKGGTPKFALLCVS